MHHVLGLRGVRSKNTVLRLVSCVLCQRELSCLGSQEPKGTSFPFPPHRGQCASSRNTYGAKLWYRWCALPSPYNTEAQHPHPLPENTTFLIAGFLPTTPTRPNTVVLAYSISAFKKPPTFIHTEDYKDSHSMETKKTRLYYSSCGVSQRIRISAFFGT